MKQIFLVHFVAITAVACFASFVRAQDVKKGVTRLADVDADYHIQGEYSGSVRHPDGYCRAVGLQVVALGDGKFSALWYPGGLPGNGYDGSTRQKLNGSRGESGVVLSGEGVGIELTAGAAATVKNASGATLGWLQPMLRYSLTEGATAPANAIILFDGKNVDRWKNAKVTGDGLLEVGAETKDSYANFTLHAEFQLPYKPFGRGQDRGNSGFYLQKRYEVQVLDSFGQELQNNDCASLYKFKAPNLNMCFPPLRWQTYDINLTSPKFDSSGKRIAKGRITVRHNGIVVHDNLELENKTGGGSPEGPNPLPILLQNHGNPVHFRNIWLVDHDAPQPIVSPATSSACVPACVCIPEVSCRRHRRVHRCR